MRLLYVIHSFPPRSSGGSDIACQRVCAWMAAKGHEVHVLTRLGDDDREYGAIEETRQLGFTVHWINRTYARVQRFEDCYVDTVVEKAFVGLLDRLEPDIVHFQHLTHLSLRLPEIAKARGFKVAFTLHDYWLFCQLGQLLTKDLERCSGPRAGKCMKCCADQLFSSPTRERVAELGPLHPKTVLPHLRARREMSRRLQLGKRQWRAVDLFISSSDYLRDWFVRLGMPPGKIITLDNGYDLDQFAGVPPPRSEAPLRFGYIGTLIPSKGVHVLVEAFRRVRGEAELKIHGGYTVFHAGHEDYLEKLHATAEGDPRIRFEGAYELERVAEVMAGLDVLIVPSIWYENSPLTIHEGFLAGRPLITCAIGGMKELVKHGENGLLFEPENPADLAGQIQRLVDEPSLVPELAKPGRLLSNDDVGRRLVEIYRGWSVAS